MGVPLRRLVKEWCRAIPAGYERLSLMTSMVNPIYSKNGTRFVPFSDNVYLRKPRRSINER